MTYNQLLTLLKVQNQLLRLENQELRANLTRLQNSMRRWRLQIKTIHEAVAKLKNK